MSDNCFWQPSFCEAADGLPAISALSGRDTSVFRYDTIKLQLHELLALRHPAERLNGADLDALLKRHLDGTPLSAYGKYAYFPWSRRLVRLLPADEFREVRADRNRNKITKGEQATLRRAVIGVVGLSVGQSAAVTMALEGVGGRFRLADFDTLGLSNLNRLRAGVHDLGVNKAILAARQMYEIDPYLEIELFPGGIDATTMPRFLGDGDDRLNVLVEECDDFHMKFLARESARARHIPVVMDTNDRGMLDIERFDLEPDRPIFHGLAPALEAETLRGLTIEQKIPHLLKIVGRETLSPRLTASLPEIRRSISTWPQLASGVALGGALLTDVVRRMLLNEFTKSGRFYVDPERLVADQTA